MSAQITFGAWLKRRRTELGITRDELSERVGFSLDMLRKLESDQRRPSGQIAHLLADYFAIPADEREAFVTFARTGRENTRHLSAALSSAAHAAGAGGDSAPWRRAYVHLTNLPALLTPLIGRERDLAAVRATILGTGGRLLTIVGAPGIGKTSLGLQLAWELIGHFDDGAYLVDLAPIVDPNHVLASVAYAIGLKEEADRSLESMLFDYLRERRMLLLLDNFEQVLDAAPAVARMMQSSPWLKMVVTSREALHIRGEHRYALHPLEAPSADGVPQLDLEAVAGYPAVSLFVERARTIQPDFVLDERNAYSVARICSRLGGLPLAIELIAARVRLFGPDALLKRLERSGDLALLTGGARDLPTRHSSLFEAISWSYGLLSGAEQALFRRLGVFAGGFTVEAVVAVCNGAGDLSLDPLEGIASLLDKSLLTSVQERVSDSQQVAGAGRGTREGAGSTDGDGSAGLRFSMLETIREYAAEELRRAGEAEQVQRRHALFFMELAERVEPELKGPDQAAWLARLESEYNNIRVALDWSSDNDAEITVRLMYALLRFWYIRGHYSEGSAWLERVLAGGDNRSTPLRAKALFVAGHLAGVTERAILYLEESAALARELGDNRLLSNVLSQMGVILLEEGDSTRAKSLFEECLVLDREHGDRYGIAWLLTALGEIARSQGDYTQARAYYEEGLLLAREAGNKYNTSTLVGNLAFVALEEGEYARAIPLVREAMALGQEVGYAIGVAGCVATIASIAAAQQEPYRAARLFGAVNRFLQTSDDRFDAVDRRVFERYETLAQAQMGEDDYRKALAEGRVLTLEAAIDYALQE